MNPIQARQGRKVLRVPDYDYSQNGAYFVTMCTFDKQCFLGTIADGTVVLSEFGKIVQQTFHWLNENYAFVSLDESVIMPNHIHMLIWLNSGKDTSNPKSLGSIIGAFKTVSSKRLQEALGERSPRPVWQRGYYEHIVRADESLYKIRQYIIDNPLKWDLDSENPERSMVTKTNAVN